MCFTGQNWQAAAHVFWWHDLWCIFVSMLKIIIIITLLEIEYCWKSLYYTIENIQPFVICGQLNLESKEFAWMKPISEPGNWSPPLIYLRMLFTSDYMFCVVQYGIGYVWSYCDSNSENISDKRVRDSIIFDDAMYENQILMS